MTEVTVDKKTKGVLVYAKPKPNAINRDEWLVLIHHVEDRHDIYTKKPTLGLARHISYDLRNGETYISYNGGYGNWGDISFFDLYTPTEEHVNIIKKILKDKKCKFVRALNKIIPV